LIHLHPHGASKLGDWTVVDSAAAGAVEYSAFSRVTIREREAHFDILGQWSTPSDEFIPFIHVLNKYSLLNCLVDDELISNKVVIDLCTC